MTPVSNPSTVGEITTPSKIQRPPTRREYPRDPRQDYSQIPIALQSLPQWLVWRSEMRNGKPSKVPYDAKTGDKGKSNDPTTWCDFVTAINTVHQNTRYAGIGFAFRAGDGLTGIDIDYPWEHPVAATIRERFHGTYCEQSPSGKLRIFCYGKPLCCGKGTEDKKLEIYDHTSPRYLTVTGRHIAGTAKEVTEQQAALVAFHEAYFKPREPYNPSLPVTRIMDRQDDQALIDRATQAKNGGKFAALFYGGWHESNDPSVADLALCSFLAFYTQDLQQIDRLFRQSALFRPKWDERHYSDGRTYGQATIAKALSTRNPQSIRRHVITTGRQPIPTQRETHDWETMIPFHDINAPEIPARLLPGIFGEFAAALAHSTETPEAMAVMCVLGALSVATTKRFVVSPKDGWREPVNLYLLIALPPANNKTLVLHQVTAPLVAWEREQSAILATEIQRQRSEQKTREKMIDALRVKCAKAQDPDQQRELIREISDREAQMKDPPALPCLFANDATPEALANNVHAQGGRFAVFSDEGGIIEVLAGLYTQGTANIDILLKGIDGGHVRIRRKDYCMDLNPFLTLVLTVQPVVIQTMGDKRAYRGKGVLERFLYVLPKSRLGYRTHDNPPIPEAIQGAYHTAIQALLNLSPLAVGGVETPRVLFLSPEALREWWAFQATIEVQLRPGGRLSLCPGWGGKLCGFALRIAGLMHLAEQRIALAHDQPGSVIIAVDIMTKALELAALLTQHALAAYGLMGADQATEDAKEIFHWLQTLGKATFTKTEVTLAMRNKKLGKSERLSKALDILIDRNMLSTQQLTTRKPTTLYHLHPDLAAQE